MPAWCNFNGKCVMVPILLTIILVYEVKTRALLTLITGEKREGGPLETSKDSEHYCDRVVRLADYDQLPAVMLASFPGSGNTWARQLIEDVTGYYTGSVYNEETLYRTGFIGEYDHASSGRTVAVKTHGVAMMEYAEGVILVVRNPYNAILADFNRQASGSHTGTATLEDFANSEMWKEFVPGHIKRWGATHLFYGEYANITNIPLHVLYFEEIQTDVKTQMENVLGFYSEHFSLEPSDQDKRFECLLQDKTKFHREKVALDFELFSDEMVTEIEDQIAVVQAFFKTLNLPPVPSSYFRKPKSAAKYEASDMEKQLGVRHTLQKIKRALEYRKNLIDSNAYRFHYEVDPTFLSPFDNKKLL